MKRTMEEIMRTQDFEANKVAKMQDDVNYIRSELHRCYKKVSDIEKDLFKVETGTPQEYILNLLQNDKNEYNRLVKRLNTHPEFKLAGKLEEQYAIQKYLYYFTIGDYFQMIEVDREELFEETYMKRLDELADEGWFMYHLRAPEINLFSCNDNFEKYIVEIYSNNNYFFLDHFLARTLNPGRDKNELRISKINDMKEVISNLKSGNYRSAARTMFALLENEHRNASDIKTRSSGHQRSNEINKFVSKLESKYLTRVWEKIDKYYKLITSGNDDTLVVNRNQLAHGNYDYEVTNVDVLKLIFMYSTFKEVSFNIQIRIEYKKELENDKKFLDLSKKRKDFN